MIVQFPVLGQDANRGTTDSAPVPPIPPDLATITVGLLDNSKAGARVIIDTLGARLTERHPSASVIRARKVHASIPMTDEIRNELGKADLVIAALGDCGSCTSWTVHDAVALEQDGTPTIVACTKPFETFARAQADALGHPLRLVVLDHPIAELPDAEVVGRTEAVLDQFETLLTQGAGPTTDGAVPATALRAGSPLLEADVDADQLLDLLDDRRISDGLPVVPPTPERIEAMLAGCTADPDEVVGRMPPKYGDITLRSVAALSVMAGCRPDYLPVVVAALRAALEPSFNLNGIQSTTHPVAVLTVVNGPVAQATGMNSGHNAFGPGNRANATIGRGIRLALLALGGAYPGDGDMATMGSPAKYTYAIAENEAGSPWDSLAVTRGYSADDSVVTVFGAEAPQNVNDHESKSGLGLLRMIAGTMRSTGINNSYYADGEVLVALSPEHAQTMAADGYSREDVQRYLWHEGRTPISYFSEGNIRQRLQTRFPGEFAEYGAHTLVPVVHDAANVIVCVVGGAGKHSMFIPSLGATRAASALVTDL